MIKNAEKCNKQFTYRVKPANGAEVHNWLGTRDPQLLKYSVARVAIPVHNREGLNVIVLPDAVCRLN